MSQYQPHAPGEAPSVPPRDARGVQQFASKLPDPCPKGMTYDPATGECTPDVGTTT
jgi:hypothetical protein